MYRKIIALFAVLALVLSFSTTLAAPKAGKGYNKGDQTAAEDVGSNGKKDKGNEEEGDSVDVDFSGEVPKNATTEYYLAMVVGSTLRVGMTNSEGIANANYSVSAAAKAEETDPDIVTTSNVAVSKIGKGAQALFDVTAVTAGDTDVTCAGGKGTAVIHVNVYELPTGLTAVYSEKLDDVELPEHWSWKDDTLSVGSAGENTFAALYDYDDDGENYEAIEHQLTVTVEPKSLLGYVLILDIPDAGYTENGNQKCPEVEKVVKAGTYLELSLTADDYDLTYTNNVKAAKSTDAAAPTVTLTGKGNYKDAISATFTIKAAPVIPDDPDDPVKPDDPIVPAEYTISLAFDAAKGSVTADLAKAAEGDLVTVKIAAVKGYTLETVTVAKKGDGEVRVNTVTADTAYSFTMPGEDVTVKVTFMEDNTMLNFFADVKADDYFYDAVLWAAQNNITQGVDATHFAPDAVTTRAQMVTFLWRAAGCPEPTVTECPFADVAADAYYLKAVLWAVEKGITKGATETTFAPDAVVNREQVVTFLYRFSEDAPAPDTANTFTDVDETGYSFEAILWAVESGITKGTSATTFSPKDTCTRGQIVTLLYRYFAD